MFADAEGSDKDTHGKGGDLDTYGENWKGFQRYRIPRLSQSTAGLVEEILRERLLPFISKEMPTVEDYLWARSDAACAEPGCNLAPPAPREKNTELGSLPYRFAPQEPAINRYTDGGEFPVRALPASRSCKRSK